MSRRPAAACGTRSGYMRHLRRAEPACDSCRVAENTYQRGRREYQRGRGGSYRPANLRRSLDVDPVAVQRMCCGQPPAVCTVGERLTAVDQLTRRGLAAVEVGRRLGITERSVLRYRVRLQATGGAR